MAESSLFPPQDLARLVLGYLEEEECTSAYEEFMKSSPHLDAFRANYNDAFMSLKTLKDVFGEYCAFKVYTRNCKIPGLRAHLQQCKTLLDTAKFLIANVDLKKVQDSNPRSSCNFTMPSQPPKRRECEVCKTIDNVDVCECRSREPILPNLFATPFKTIPPEVAALSNIPLDTLVQTTQLDDLPGSSTTAKRKSDNLAMPSTVPSMKQNEGIPGLPRVASTVARSEEMTCEQESAKASASTGATSLNLSVKTSDVMNCSVDINEILSIVSRNNSTVNASTSHPVSVKDISKDNTNSEEPKRRVSSIERSFKEFASGVSSGDSKITTEAMPDSSTPESNTSQVAQSSKSCEAVIQKITTTETLKTKLVPKSVRQTLNEQVVTAQGKFSGDMERSNDSSASSGFEGINVNTDKVKPASQTHVCSSSTKGYESKVEIISDELVKMDNKKIATNTVLRQLRGKPPGLKSFNTFPSAHLPFNSSIIHVNGQPAYQNKNPDNVYTKEQIMEMPIIVMQLPTTVETTSICTNMNYTSAVANATVTSVIPADSGYKSLEPLSVDVGLAPEYNPVSQIFPNGQIPKETVSLEKMTTPNKPLLVKKASSTPRRNSLSHVRTLDFTTPRRILPKESIPEEVYSECPTTTQLQSGLSSSDVSSPAPTNILTDSNKKPETIKKIKAGWDADLRALVPSGNSEISTKKRPKSIIKKKRSPKKASKSVNSDKLKRTTKSAEQTSKKSETKLKKKKSTTDKELNDELPVRPCVKPTLNVIKDWREGPKLPLPKEEKVVEIYIPDSTPETDDRPKTANPPSTKHNLSDLFGSLQTPLKRIIDNLQINTPRFGDFESDVPISDIKIDAIPTPSFTPNFLMRGGIGEGGVGGTPSSYSSRPTDYSSGSSYYKPDEHDYAPIPDLQPAPLPLPTSPRQGCIINTCETPKNKVQKESINTTIKSSRPRRQCTLKVSYRETPTISSGKSLSKSDTSKESNKSENESSHSPIASLVITETSEQNDSEKFINIKKEVRKEIFKGNNLTHSKEDMLRELEMKRKRTIAGLKKKTPVKRKRKSGSSFPKVKIIEKKAKSTKKPKTVAELRQSIGPRKISVNAKERFRTKSMSKGNSECSTPLSTVSAPPRSRRKSSTPRKVDKFVTHSLDDSISVEIPAHKPEVDMTEEELPPLRVSSDDGSQDSRCRRIISYEEAEVDDIHQIKAYIENASAVCEQPTVQELVQRGFDLETAKSIERDLLGTPRHEAPDKRESQEDRKIILDVREELTKKSKLIVTIEPPNTTNIGEVSVTNYEALNLSSKTNVTKDSNGNCSSKNDSAIILEGDIIMVRESFDEESDNYFSCQFCDEEVEKNCVSNEKIDENFALQIQCDDFDIRVCLEKQETLYDIPPMDVCVNEQTAQNVEESIQSTLNSDSEVNKLDAMETQNAVQSISNIQPLYTPIKVDHNSTLQRQCLDIFDSTLNSLDTPIKTSGLSKSSDALNPHEEDAQESWQHASATKRKKSSESPIQESSSKKSKPDHQILMQDIDIESLLTKLHGENPQ